MILSHARLPVPTLPLEAVSTITHLHQKVNQPAEKTAELLKEYISSNNQNGTIFNMKSRGIQDMLSRLTERVGPQNRENSNSCWTINWGGVSVEICLTVRETTYLARCFILPSSTSGDVKGGLPEVHLRLNSLKFVNVKFSEGAQLPNAIPNSPFEEVLSVMLVTLLPLM